MVCASLREWVTHLEVDSKLHKRAVEWTHTITEAIQTHLLISRCASIKNHSWSQLALMHPFLKSVSFSLSCFETPENEVVHFTAKHFVSSVKMISSLTNGFVTAQSLSAMAKVEGTSTLHRHLTIHPNM